MSQAAHLKPVDEGRASALGPLDAVLALCSRTAPAVGGADARELSRLLAAAARAGGAEAAERIEQATGDAPWRVAAPSCGDAPCREEKVPNRADDERRLVAKLAGCGRLHPGLLVSALDQGRTAFFHAALAALSRCDRPALGAAVSRTSTALALAVRAAGVDRAAFPAILARLRALEGDLTGAQAQTTEETTRALALSPPEASLRLVEALRT